MIQTFKTPEKARYLLSLLVLALLAVKTKQWLLYPQLQQELQFAQEGSTASEVKEAKKNQKGPITQKTNFISQLRMKNGVKGSSSVSPFPFDPDRGYINLYDENNSMWYWHFRAEKNPERAPLIIWLQGGPGGASSSDVFISSGPFSLKNYSAQNPKVGLKNTTWAKAANLIYPDFPLGVGFSTVTTEHVSLGKDQVMEQILIFFTKFLKKYPEYKKRPVYISGGSYGGHWVPYVATALKYSGNPDINVQGFYITDGMMHAQDMLSNYLDFALLRKKYTGFTQQDYKNLVNLRDFCLHTFNVRPNRLWTWNYFFICAGSYSGSVIATIKKNNPRFDPYYMPGNFTKPQEFKKFLNTPSIQQFLGVRKDKFKYVNSSFTLVFAPRDFYVDVRPLLGRLLNDGVKGVVSVGNLDFITGYQQSEMTVAGLPWQHQNEYNSKERKPCKLGYCKEYLNLREYRVNGSGHEICLYEPEYSLEIIESMINWEPKSEVK